MNSRHATNGSFSRRYAERAATDAALRLARGRFGVSDGRREAVWRVRDDGIIELARAYSGAVELLEVFEDGSSVCVATSPKSTRKQVAEVLEITGVGLFALGFPLGFLVSRGFFALALVWPLLALLAAVMKWRSHVRPWVRSRFGTDDGWADVPWQIDGNPTTGSQVVALSAIARGSNHLSYRVRDDGDLEVASRRRGPLLRVDRAGNVSAVDGFSNVRLADVRQPGVVWHRVLSSDPD